MGRGGQFSYIPTILSVMLKVQALTRHPLRETWSKTRSEKNETAKRITMSPKSPRILVRRNVAVCRGEKAKGCHSLL